MKSGAKTFFRTYPCTLTVKPRHPCVMKSNGTYRNAPIVRLSLTRCNERFLCTTGCPNQKCQNVSEHAFTTHLSWKDFCPRHGPYPWKERKSTDGSNAHSFGHDRSSERGF